NQRDPLGSTPPTTPAASHAKGYTPTRCPSRSWASAPSRSCRRSPASVVVLRQLQVEAPARHAYGDVADAGPGVKPGAQRGGARPYEAGEPPAKPSAAIGSRPRASSMCDEGTPDAASFTRTNRRCPAGLSPTCASGVLSVSPAIRLAGLTRA